MSHRDLSELTPDEITAELLQTNAVIRDITGVEPPKLYRPPYGAVSDRLKNVSARLGMSLINWSIDPLDWKYQEPDRIYNEIMLNLHDNAIILSHDIWEATAQAMERVIPSLLERGYKLVTVSELMRYSGVTLESGIVYDNGGEQ